MADSESKRVKSSNISSIICRYVTACVVMSLGLFVVVSMLFVFCSTLHVLVEGLKSESENAAHRVQWVIKSYKNIAEGLGSIPELSLPGVSDRVRYIILGNRCREYNLSKCVIVDKDGYSTMDGEYRGDRIYFKEAVKGNVVISEPFVSDTDGVLYYVIAAPIWKGGVYKGSVESVLACYLDSSILNSITEELCTKGKDDAVILGRSGNVVASSDIGMVLSRHNNIKLAETNPKYSREAVMNRRALDGFSKVQFILRNFALECYSSTLIEETPGWVIIVRETTSDYMGFILAAGLFLLLVASVIIISLRARIQKQSDVISRPVVKMASRLSQAAVGDFSSTVDYDESIEEIKIISEATQSLVNRMSFVLGDRKLNSKGMGISNFVNFAEYANMISLFEELFKCKICIYDADMKIALGEQVNNPKRVIRQSILVNGKLIGIYTFYPLESCSLSDEELKRILFSLSSIAGRSAETLIEHEAVGRLRKDNERFSYELIVSGAEKFSQILENWISKFGKGGKNEVTGELVTDLGKIRDYLVKNVEFTRLTEYNSTLDEAEYEPEALFSEICRMVQEKKNHKNIMFATDNLPEKLFGDSHKIAKVVAQTACCLAEFQESAEVVVSVSCKSERFSEILDLSVSVRNSTLSESDVDRIGILWQKKDTVLKSGSTFEQKMSGIFMLADMLNADLTIKGGTDFEMKYEISQLPIRNEV